MMVSCFRRNDGGKTNDRNILASKNRLVAVDENEVYQKENTLLATRSSDRCQKRVTPRGQCHCVEKPSLSIALRSSAVQPDGAFVRARAPRRVRPAEGSGTAGEGALEGSLTEGTTAGGTTLVIVGTGVRGDATGLDGARPEGVGHARADTRSPSLICIAPAEPLVARRRLNPSASAITITKS